MRSIEGEAVLAGKPVNGDLALEIKFRIGSTNRVEFLQTVDALMITSSEEPGLRAVGCFEQLGVENTFLWREYWLSEADLAGRLRATSLRTLLGAIDVLGELEAFEILQTSRRSPGRDGT